MRMQIMARHCRRIYSRSSCWKHNVMWPEGRFRSSRYIMYTNFNIHGRLGDQNKSMTDGTMLINSAFINRKRLYRTLKTMHHSNHQCSTAYAYINKYQTNLPSMTGFTYHPCCSAIYNALLLVLAANRLVSKIILLNTLATSTIFRNSLLRFGRVGFGREEGANLYPVNQPAQETSMLVPVYFHLLRRS